MVNQFLDVMAAPLNVVGHQPQEAGFVDDVPTNVAAAQHFGIHAIRFLNNPQAIAEVQQFLV